MSLFKRLFGIKTTDFNQLLEDGAYIVDVRTPGEFNSGNIKESTNIPLDQIQSNLKTIKEMNKSIIFCCASGVRSGRATSIAKAIGIKSYNGGGWRSLNSKLNK